MSILYFDVNIPGIGGDFAFSACYCSWDIYIARFGFDNKYFLGKQAAAYIAGGGFDGYLGGITAFKIYVPRVSLN